MSRGSAAKQPIPSVLTPVPDASSATSESSAATSSALEASDQAPDVDDDPDPFAADPFPEEPYGYTPGERVIPEGFDLFDFPPALVAKRRAEGTDPRLHAVRIYAVKLGQRALPALGNFPAEGMSSAWFRARFESGVYDLQGLNQSGQYIGGKRYTNLAGVSNLPGPRPFVGGLGGPSYGQAANNGAGSLQDQVVAVALQRLLNPPAEPSAMGELVKALAAQSSLMATGVNLQLQAMQAAQQLQANSPQARTESGLLDFFKQQADQNAKLLAAAIAKPAAVVSASKGSDLESFLKMFTLARSLAAESGAAKSEPEESKLVEIFLGLAETMGPGLMALVAQAVLPPDRAKFICNVIEEHQRARAAQATAESSTVDTTGETVA